MNKYMILATGALLSLSSCSTISHTAQTAPVGTEVYNLTVADLTVGNNKAETTKEFKWNPMSSVSLSAQKQNATAELLKESGADILVEPQYVVTRRGPFRGGSVTVSGYPATYSNFRAMTKSDAEKIAALNGAAAGSTTIAATFPVINTTAKKAVRREQNLDLTQGSTSTNFISLLGGPTTILECEGDWSTGGNYGLMYGHYGKKWGWYVKLSLTTATFDGQHEKESKTTPSGTFGFIKTMGRHWNLLLGIGVGGYLCEESGYEEVSYYNYWNGGYYTSTEHVTKAARKFSVPVEFAFQYHVKHFNIMAGCSYATPCAYKENSSHNYATGYPSGTSVYGTGNANIFIGIGYNF